MRVKLDPGAFMPERAHETDAGYDLKTPYDMILPPTTTMHGTGWIVVDTGVHMEIPKGFCGLLVSKSGLNVKNHITGTGLVDSGYTGSIRVKLYNHTDEEHKFERGDKLIQIVILPVHTPRLELAEEIDETERGENGFGSTGR